MKYPFEHFRSFTELKKYIVVRMRRKLRKTLFIRIPYTVYVLFKIMLGMFFRQIRNIFKKGKNVEEEEEKKKKERSRRKRMNSLGME